jgi:quinol-cytochrome oxidoreductase complex cytochrome b subunit
LFHRVHKRNKQMTLNPESRASSKPIYNLLLHLHPKKVNPQTLRLNLTFGLGGMAVLLVLIQLFTGLLLKFHYIPSPDKAYHSIQNMQDSLLFGKLLHNLHHWSAILLLLITFFHMLRVLFTGAYRKPRQYTWIFGLALLLLVVLANFTGYLLPWDQISYWAITISTNLLEYIPFVGHALKVTLLGGPDVGSASLSNFFNLHTGIIPLLIIIFMAYHFWRIRKAGGVIVAEKDKEIPLVDTQPHLVARELVVALVLVAFVLMLSVFFDAPLHEQANPGFSPNPAKAPWYFMGLQELLIHFHPFFAVVIFPVAIMVGTCWLPFIKTDDANSGNWFLSEKGKKSGITALYVSLFMTVFFVLFSEMLPDPETVLPSIPSFISNGLIPFLTVVVTGFYFIKYLQKKYSLNRSEQVQSVAIVLIISYSVLTLIGIFFRGPGMHLVWPWLT